MDEFESLSHSRWAIMLATEMTAEPSHPGCFLPICSGGRTRSSAPMAFGSHVQHRIQMIRHSFPVASAFSRR